MKLKFFVDVENISKNVIFFKFWEDDEEIRIGGRAGMVHLPKGR